MTRNWRIPLTGAFFAFVVALPAAVTFYTDWLWFGETGYRDVFVRRLTAQGTLGAQPWPLRLASCSSTSGSRCARCPQALALNTREGPLPSPSIANACSPWARWWRRRWRCSSASLPRPSGRIGCSSVMGSRSANWTLCLARTSASSSSSCHSSRRFSGYLLALVALASVLAALVYVLDGALDSI